MIKKLHILVIVFCGLCITESYAQPQKTIYEDMFSTSKLPFSSLINLPWDSLTAKGFVYDASKNLFKSKHHSKATKASRFWFGENRRNDEDYEAFVYMGKKDKAILQVAFYDPILYEAIEKWIRNNNEELYHLSSSRYTALTEFKREDLNIRLTKTVKRVTSIAIENSFGVIISTLGNMRSIYPEFGLYFTRRHDSYPIYVYTVFFSESPDSKWLKKQQDKYLRKIQKNKHNTSNINALVQ